MFDKAYLSLKVYNELYYTVNKGEPVVLNLQLTYPGVIEDLHQNRLIDDRIQKLLESFEKKEITEDEYEEDLEILKAQKIEIKRIFLGSNTKPWVDYIEFKIMEDDRWTQLQWELDLISQIPLEPQLELTSETFAHVNYGMMPGKVNIVSEGTYTIKAKIDKLESNQINITFRKNTDKTPSIKKLINIIPFMIMEGEFEESLKFINIVLKTKSHSVQGYMLMGELFEARGELSKALESYEKARDEFYVQNPDAWEPPRAIESKIAKIIDLTFQGNVDDKLS